MSVRVRILFVTDSQIIAASMEKTVVFFFSLYSIFLRMFNSAFVEGNILTVLTTVSNAPCNQLSPIERTPVQKSMVVQFT